MTCCLVLCRHSIDTYSSANLCVFGPASVTPSHRPCLETLQLPPLQLLYLLKYQILLCFYELLTPTLTHIDSFAPVATDCPSASPLSSYLHYSSSLIESALSLPP